MNLNRFTLSVGILAIGLGFSSYVWAQDPAGPSFTPPPAGYPAAPPPPSAPAPAPATDGEILTKGAIHEAFCTRWRPSLRQASSSPGRRRRPLKKCRPRQSPTTLRRCGFRAIGIGTRKRRISYGSAACGVFRRRAISGCPAIGTRWPADINGFRGPGFQRKSKRCNISPIRPRASRQGPTGPRRGPIISGCPVTTCGTASPTCGGPALGRCQPGWIWVPAQYVPTPAGWIFAEGHWDQTIANRGMVFCPIYYAQPYYLRAGYYYRPSIVVTPDILTFHFFCSPYSHHYYFGDYYDDSCVRLGIVPWYDAGRYYGVVDPMYAYYRWHYVRTNPLWEVHLHGWHNYYVVHREFRPAHLCASNCPSAAGRVTTASSSAFPSTRCTATRIWDSVWPSSRGKSRCTSMSRSGSFAVSTKNRAQLEVHGGHAPGRPGERMQLARMPGHESLMKQLPPATREQMARSATAAAHPGTPAGTQGPLVPGTPAGGVKPAVKPGGPPVGSRTYAPAAKPKPKDSKDKSKDSGSR